MTEADPDPMQSLGPREFRLEVQGLVEPIRIRSASRPRSRTGGRWLVGRAGGPRPSPGRPRRRPSGLRDRPSRDASLAALGRRPFGLAPLLRPRPWPGPPRWPGGPARPRGGLAAPGPGRLRRPVRRRRRPDRLPGAHRRAQHQGRATTAAVAAPRRLRRANFRSR